MVASLNSSTVSWRSNGLVSLAFSRRALLPFHQRLLLLRFSSLTRSWIFKLEWNINRNSSLVCSLRRNFVKNKKKNKRKEKTSKRKFRNVSILSVKSARHGYSSQSIWWKCKGYHIQSTLLNRNWQRFFLRISRRKWPREPRGMAPAAKQLPLRSLETSAKRDKDIVNKRFMRPAFTILLYVGIARRGATELVVTVVEKTLSTSTSTSTSRG